MRDAGRGGGESGEPVQWSMWISTCASDLNGREQIGQNIPGFSTCRTCRIGLCLIITGASVSTSQFPSTAGLACHTCAPPFAIPSSIRSSSLPPTPLLAISNSRGLHQHTLNPDIGDPTSPQRNSPPDPLQLYSASTHYPKYSSSYKPDRPARHSDSDEYTANRTYADKSLSRARCKSLYISDSAGSSRVDTGWRGKYLTSRTGRKCRRTGPFVARRVCDGSFSEKIWARSRTRTTFEAFTTHFDWGVGTRWCPIC